MLLWAINWHGGIKVLKKLQVQVGKQGLSLCYTFNWISGNSFMMGNSLKLSGALPPSTLAPWWTLAWEQFSSLGFLEILSWYLGKPWWNMPGSFNIQHLGKCLTLFFCKERRGWQKQTAPGDKSQRDTQRDTEWIRDDQRGTDETVKRLVVTLTPLNIKNNSKIKKCRIR